MLLTTPQAANMSIGQGSFREAEQRAMLKDCVGYPDVVCDSIHHPEVLNRTIEKAMRGSAPAQMNVSRTCGARLST